LEGGGWRVEGGGPRAEGGGPRAEGGGLRGVNVLEIQDSKFEHLSAKKPRVSKQGWGNQTRSGMHHLVEEGRKWNANVLAIRSSILAREPNLSHLLQAGEMHGEISERETRWVRRFVSSLKSQTSLT